MWLSQKLRAARTAEETAADLGVTTIGGDRAGVYTRGEVRDLPVCTPGGMLWQPKSGDLVVVLKGGPGGEEVFVLGTHKEQRAAALEDGEVYLFSERASICLRNNGTIELTGQLLINGEAYAPCDCGTSGPGGL